VLSLNPSYRKWTGRLYKILFTEQYLVQIGKTLNL